MSSITQTLSKDVTAGVIFTWMLLITAWFGGVALLVSTLV